MRCTFSSTSPPLHSACVDRAISVVTTPLPPRHRWYICTIGCLLLIIFICASTLWCRASFRRQWYRTRRIQVLTSASDSTEYQSTSAIHLMQNTVVYVFLHLQSMIYGQSCKFSRVRSPRIINRYKTKHTVCLSVYLPGAQYIDHNFIYHHMQGSTCQLTIHEAGTLSYSNVDA